MKLLKLVPDNTNINFMKWRNIALILSIIATAASLALVAVKGLNLGIDFVGGQVVRVTFAQPVDIEDLRAKVDSLEVGDASIQDFGDGKTEWATVHFDPSVTAAQRQAIAQALGRVYPVEWKEFAVGEDAPIDWTASARPSLDKRVERSSR